MSSIDHLATTPQSKPQARLTATEAVEIFRCKDTKTRSTAVSKMYGVNEKTIRDIWRGRTWSKETHHLDPSRVLTTKKLGRQQGRKDSNLRKVRAPYIGAGLKVLAGNININDADDGRVIAMLLHSGNDWFSNCLSLDDDRTDPCPSIDELLYEWDRKGCWFDKILEKPLIAYFLSPMPFASK